MHVWGVLSGSLGLTRARGVSLRDDCYCVQGRLGRRANGASGNVVVAGDPDDDLLDRSQGLVDLLDAQAGRVLQVTGDAVFEASSDLALGCSSARRRS